MALLAKIAAVKPIGNRTSGGVVAEKNTADPKYIAAQAKRDRKNAKRAALMARL